VHYLSAAPRTCVRSTGEIVTDGGRLSASRCAPHTQRGLFWNPSLLAHAVRCLSKSTESTFFPMTQQPLVGHGPLIIEDSLWHTHTLIWNSLDKLSAWRRDLYLTTHNTHEGQTSMSPAGFEPPFPASERPQTYALDRAVTGIGLRFTDVCKFHFNSTIILRALTERLSLV
jgi:hypothetical protein